MDEKKYSMKDIFSLISRHCLMCDNGVAGAEEYLVAVHEVGMQMVEETGWEAIQCEYCGRMISGIKNELTTKEKDKS